MGTYAPVLDTNNEIAFDYADMMRITRKLSGILEKEIMLLKDMKIARIHELYNDKIELSNKLELYKEMLVRNPDLLNSIPKQDLEQIRKEATAFESLVAEDLKQMNRAKEVHTLVMEAIRKTLEKNVIMGSGYNKKGVIDLGLNGPYVAAPVSINENI